jgi:DNA-directed RNA polymerase specialized sigma24 family protein
MLVDKSALSRCACGTLFDRHRGLTRSVCRHMLSSDDVDDDALQEAALQALLNLDCIRQPDCFGAWFAGIAIHVCHRLLRRRSRTTGRWRHALAVDRNPRVPASEPRSMTLSRPPKWSSRFERQSPNSRLASVRRCCSSTSAASPRARQPNCSALAPAQSGRGYAKHAADCGVTCFTDRRTS